MKLSSLRFVVLATSSCAAFAFACGGISDPTRASNAESVATVSGALTGVAVPPNARVALVWSNGAGGQAVGSDVAVVGGKFAMSLAAPPASYFANVEGQAFGSGSSSRSGSGSVPPTEDDVPEPAPLPPPPSGGGSSSGATPGFAMKLSPRDVVSGGITSPLSAAIAGFVVYADANGNGKLDLEGDYASSPDQILGGNKELLLAYFKDGGALDYEKLRDTSGILPAAGFNLAWLEGRWLPLNVVELKLGANAQLPSPVCSFSGPSSGSGGTDVGGEPVPLLPEPGSSSSGGTPGSDVPPSYPASNDPNLSCSPDGRSFSYVVPANCPPPEPPPVGLCAGDTNYSTPGCARGGYGESLPDGATPPPGWPCVVAPLTDGGPAPDGGGTDAGPGGSGVDAGSGG